MVSEPPVIVSACLLGRRCRYDGGHRESRAVRSALVGRPALPLCPEELAGLGTPRPPLELEGGDGEAVRTGTARVKTRAGADVTAALVAGATAALALARAAGAREAILKDGSPSCGSRTVHRDGALRPGAGVFAALLKANRLAVTCDADLDAATDAEGCRSGATGPRHEA